MSLHPYHHHDLNSASTRHSPLPPRRAPCPNLPRHHHRQHYHSDQSKRKAQFGTRGNTTYKSYPCALVDEAHLSMLTSRSVSEMRNSRPVPYLGMYQSSSSGTDMPDLIYLRYEGQAKEDVRRWRSCESPSDDCGRTFATASYSKDVPSGLFSSMIRTHQTNQLLDIVTTLSQPLLNDISLP